MQAVDKRAIFFLMHVSPLRLFTIICEYIHYFDLINFFFTAPNKDHTPKKPSPLPSSPACSNEVK